MSKKRQNWMKKADVLFSKVVRLRDGRCMAAGTDTTECRGVLQCAHIISRSYKSIRCDLDNAVALCQAHHTLYTHRPLEWREWVEARFPGRWDFLTSQALRYDRVDWKAEHEELKALLDELEAA